LQWNGGDDMTAGTMTNVADLDFTIDIDPATGVELVIMNDTVHTRHHADLLARHILKFEEIVRDLEAPAAAGPAAAAAAAAAPAGRVAA
jgi:translation initiation factor 3 subunit L